MNLNKLFPRLSLRAKLAVAFAGIAVIPLLLVAAATVRVTISRLRELARVTLEHDLATAQEQAERQVAQAERDVEYLAEAFVGDDGRPEATASKRDHIADFLGYSPAILQLKILTPEGGLMAVVRAKADSVALPTPAEGSGVYYALRASSLAPGDHLVLPAELRVEGGDVDEMTLPVLAIIRGVYDPAAGLRAVVVGEVRASEVFGALDRAAPQFAGVTILSDEDGNVLYHSEHKRDWSSLLASGRLARRDGNTSGVWGRALISSGDEVVLTMPLRLGGSGSPVLSLFRAVPASTLNQPINEFLSGVAVVGGLVLLLVLGLAVFAARQLSEPLYRLREAARRLGRGGEVEDPGIFTNDEIEDLSREFVAMARALTQHRHDLELLVSDRTRALERAHAELRDVLAHSADAIIVLDTEGRVRVWNDGAERLFGYSADQALGQNADRLLLPEGAAGAAESRYIARELEISGAVENLVTRRRARDAALVPVSLTQSRITDTAGRPHGTSLILRDMSLQRKVEDQMRRSERIATVSVLAAGLAHEINNPLAVIQNRLECMISELAAGQPAAARDLAVLQEHTARLQEVTRNLLRFVRDYDQAAGPVDLSAVIERLARLLERTLVGRNVTVQLVTDGVSPRAWGSEAALETVCLNLLLNAADAMSGGGIITVRVQAGASEQEVEFAVEDQGPGVPPELRQRIFEPFFTTKTETHGTGLGLAVCRSILGRLGGRIWVEPLPSGGSRFVVAVPASAEVAA